MLKKAFIILLASGWLLFLVLAWFSRDRIMDKLGIQRGAAENRMLVRARTEWYANDLASNPWLGDRPPVLFLGDSHLELGKWYPLFRGRFPVRNMGISMSRIADTKEIADRLEPGKASALVLLSGSNDLTAGASVDECMDSFRELFDTVKAKYPERPVIVLSLPPAGRDLGGQSVSEINAKITGLNKGLSKEALLHGFTFLDLTSLLAKGNALDPALTFDGQHLNDAGYAAIANPLFETLTEVFPLNP